MGAGGTQQGREDSESSESLGDEAAKIGNRNKAMLASKGIEPSVKPRARPISEQNEYLSTVHAIREAMNKAGHGSPGESRLRAGAIVIITKFLSRFSAGVAFDDALRNVGRLILAYGLEPNEVPNLGNHSDPRMRLLSWLADQNAQRSGPVLRENEMNLILKHEAWMTLLLVGMKRWPKTPAVSDQQLESIGSGTVDPQGCAIVAHLLTVRGRFDQAKLFFERCIQAGMWSQLREHATIKALMACGLSECASQLTSESLLTEPPGNESEFFKLLALAAEFGLWDEIILASDCLAPHQMASLPAEISRNIRRLELLALLRRREPLFNAGIKFYRIHHDELLADASLPPYLPDLARAARLTHHQEILREILTQCKGNNELPDAGEWWRLRAEIFESDGELDSALNYWQKIPTSQADFHEVLGLMIENRLRKHDERTAEDLAMHMLESPDRETKIHGLSYQVLANVSSPEKVFEIIRTNQDVLGQRNPLRERVVDEYAKTLCARLQWRDLRDFLDSDRPRSPKKRFYLHLAQIMCYVQQVTAAAAADLSLQKVLFIAHHIISSPMTTDQLLMLLNVDFVGLLDSAVFTADRANSPALMEPLKEEVELRVALEIEALIKALDSRHQETINYKERLRNMTLGQDSRQLLEDLYHEKIRLEVGWT